VIALALSMLLATAIPVPDVPLAPHVDDLIARGRFFDAHVHCMVGAIESASAEARTWFAVRDAFSLWMLGDQTEALRTLETTAAPAEQNRASLALAAAWLQSKGGDEAPLATLLGRSSPPELAARVRTYLDVLHGRDPAPIWGEGLATAARAYRERPTQSPLLVGILSAVLPGAGHARLGLWGDAATALALNTVSIGATVELSRARLVLPAIAAGLVASLFYVGAIVSSTGIATERNASEREERLENVSKLLFPELPTLRRR
jgi:hypothetical protein